MGFPRQEYWNVLPLPSPGDLPNLRIELESPVLAGGLFTILTGKKEKKKPTGTLIRNLQELLILKIQEWRRMSRYSVLLLLTFSGWDLTRVHLPVSFAPIE